VAAGDVEGFKLMLTRELLLWFRKRAEEAATLPAAAVAGPYRVVAGAVWHPGADRGELYSPGPQSGVAFIAGHEEGGLFQGGAAAGTTFIEGPAAGKING